MPIRPLAPRFYFALAALICLGVFFRFYHLDKKIFWMDEAASALRIAGYSQADLHAQTQRQKLWTSAELQKFQHIRRDFDLRDALRVLSKDAPQHTPLFYLLLRLWAGAFGDSVWALRALPALLSLMVFPALWFLCRELFFDDPKRERIIFVALALMAVSPFHVLYAQEARQYSLMTVLLLASTALLLRALRCGEWRWWLPYAICLALGFYTHLLFALMWLAHAAIVATWFYLQRNNTREPSKTKVSLVPLISFGIAAVVAALLFVPWAIVLWQGQERAASTTSWMLDNSRPWYVVKTWVLVWSHLFYDPNQTQQWSGAARDWAGLAMAARLARIAVCGAILWALGFVWRRAPRRRRCIDSCCGAFCGDGFAGLVGERLPFHHSSLCHRCLHWNATGRSVLGGRSAVCFTNAASRHLRFRRIHRDGNWLVRLEFAGPSVVEQGFLLRCSPRGARAEQAKTSVAGDALHAQHACHQPLIKAAGQNLFFR
jgi:uncharacterized membrane protein